MTMPRWILMIMVSYCKNKKKLGKNEKNWHRLSDLVQVNHFPSWKHTMPNRAHQSWVIFKSWFLWKASSKWADLFDLHKQCKTHELLTEYLKKIFFFLSYLTLNFLKKNVSIEKYDANFIIYISDLERALLNRATTTTIHDYLRPPATTHTTCHNFAATNPDHPRTGIPLQPPPTTSHNFTATTNDQP